MKEPERKEQASLPPCPNPNCAGSHVVRNGSHRGRRRYHCRTCQTYFGETQGTPMYGLKTPAAEVGPSPVDRDAARQLACCRRDHGPQIRDDQCVAQAGGDPCRVPDAGAGQRSALESGRN